VTAPDGLFSKDRFAIDLDKGTVTCPAGVTVQIRGHLMAYFGGACTDCPLRAAVHYFSRWSHHQDQSLRGGSQPRQIAPGRKRLARRLPRHPTRVERKIAHLVYADTEDGEPACAARPRSTPTSASSQVPPISPVSHASVSDGPLAAGRSSSTEEA